MSELLDAVRAARAALAAGDAVAGLARLEAVRLADPASAAGLSPEERAALKREVDAALVEAEATLRERAEKLASGAVARRAESLYKGER